MDGIKPSDMGVTTFGWWDFGLFGRHHRHLLFRDHFSGSLGDLKDINKSTLRGYEDDRNKIFLRAEELHLFKSKVSDKYL